MKLSSNQFTLDRNTRTYSAEISNFGKGFRFEQLYPDSCDLGFVLVSPTTGHEATYYVSRTEKDVDGDVTYWLLIPTPVTLRKYPILGDTRILIYND